MLNATKISDDYVIALSALVQSAYIVNRLATSEHVANEDSKILLKSIYKTDTFDSISIYENIGEVILGASNLKAIEKNLPSIDILVIKLNFNFGSELLEKAKNLGTNILKEEEFLNLITNKKETWLKKFIDL